MRSDGRVAIRFGKPIFGPVTDRYLRESAIALGIGGVLDTEASKTTIDAGAHKYEDWKQQAGVWSQNISAWWLMNSGGSSTPAPSGSAQSIDFDSPLFSDPLLSSPNESILAKSPAARCFVNGVVAAPFLVGYTRGTGFVCRRISRSIRDTARVGEDVPLQRTDEVATALAKSGEVMLRSMRNSARRAQRGVYQGNRPCGRSA